MLILSGKVLDSIKLIVAVRFAFMKLVVVGAAVIRRLHFDY